MHGSMQELLGLGDHVEVWPAHIGGSLCGGAGLSGKTSSTIGFERLHNPLLQVDEEQFVDGSTKSMPSRPPNVEADRRAQPAADAEPSPRAAS